MGSNVVEDGGSMFLKHFGTPYLQVHRVLQPQKTNIDDNKNSNHDIIIIDG